LDLEIELKYKAYTHKYKENDVVIIQLNNNLPQINKLLCDEFTSNILEDTSWYLSKIKSELLSNKKFIIVSCISWHVGIPFYLLADIEDDQCLVHVGEFYLKKLIL